MDSPKVKLLLDRTIETFPENVICKGINRNYPLYNFVLRKVLLPLISANPTVSKVLDVGAGVGIYSLILAKMGLKCHAIDTWAEYDDSNSMGPRDKILSRLEKNKVSVLYCDILKSPLPFADGSFDLVLFTDVLEHFVASKKVLKEISRILRRGGFLVIETPNAACLQNRLRLLFGKSVYSNLEYWFNAEPYFGHIREYSIGEIHQMLKWTDIQPQKGFLTSSSKIATEISIRKHRTSDSTTWLDSWSSREYIPEFRVRSPADLAKAVYLGLTFLFPALRETIIVLGRKV